MGSTNQVKISAAFLVTFERAHSFKPKHLGKWRQTLTVTRTLERLLIIRSEQNQSNSISTSNNISSSSSNSFSSVMERTPIMIQISSRNFNRLRSNARLRASGMMTLLHEL